MPFYYYTNDQSRQGIETEGLGEYGVYVRGYNIRNGHCRDCGHDPDAVMYHDTFYCPGCALMVCRDNWDSCPNCGACLCSDHRTVRDDDDFGDMDDDYESDRGRGINSYSYKPSPMWFGGVGAPYYMGMELEISADDSASAWPIYNWAADRGYRDLFYCKEDGSVEGFEIVSHPMTPEFVRDFPWDAFFDMLNQEYPLSRGGVHSERRDHGLHIHVSRSAFKGNVSALARFSYLLNMHSDQVTRIARRGRTEYTSFTDAPVSEVAMSHQPWLSRWSEAVDRSVYSYDTGTYEAQTAPKWAKWAAYGPNSLTGRVVQEAAQGGTYLQRYRAVNLLNRETVEIRAFRSTRNASELWDAFSLLIDAVSFSTNMQLRHKPIAEVMTWDAFHAFRNGDETYHTYQSALASA
jgi:hypothetical protein